MLLFKNRLVFSVSFLETTMQKNAFLSEVLIKFKTVKLETELLNFLLHDALSKRRKSSLAWKLPVHSYFLYYICKTSFKAIYQKVHLIMHKKDLEFSVMNIMTFKTKKINILSFVPNVNKASFQDLFLDLFKTNNIFINKRVCVNFLY